MFAKLLLIILAAGLTAATLLVIRQERISTAHTMSAVHERLLKKERTLWRMQGEIARRCRPEEVRLMMEGMPIRWKTIPDPSDAVAILTDADIPHRAANRNAY